MAEEMDEFKSKGATVIALTPELPEFSKETATANDVPFPILTDLNLKVAESYGLVFDLGIIADLYEGFAKISEKNGPEAGEKLPLTPTYIIDSSGIIRYTFIDPNYRKRAEPSDLLEELDKIRKSASSKPAE